MRGMARALILIAARPLPQAEELLRGALVIGCALALIMAGPPLPL
jgi:hypothetical protein